MTRFSILLTFAITAVAISSRDFDTSIVIPTSTVILAEPNISSSALSSDISSSVSADNIPTSLIKRTSNTNVAPLDTPQLTVYPDGSVVLPIIKQDPHYIDLPFNFTVTEECEDDGSIQAAGFYENGNIIYNMTFLPGHRFSIQHSVPGYPPLIVGPYIYQESEVEFAYNGWEACSWDNAGRECGSCQPLEWTNVLECPENSKTPSVPTNHKNSRTRTMICSVILGPTVNQNTTPSDIPEVHTVPGINDTIIITHHTDTNFSTAQFDFGITEECDDNGNEKVKGLYVIDNTEVHLVFFPGQTIFVNSSENSPPLNIGPYDFANSTDVKFTFDGKDGRCQWQAGEKPQDCGSCNATAWSGGPLDCKSNHVIDTMPLNTVIDSSRIRTRDMQCIFNLERIKWR